MSFARPDLLWLALFLPALLAGAVWGWVRRRRRVARALGDAGLVRRIGAGDLERFPRRRAALVVVAAAALGLAAAGPQWGTEVVETRSRSLDLVLALDVSKSMLARDVSPNRLERARLLAHRLLRELEGDRIGLVVFSGRAYVLSPLTVDHGALQLYVDALDPEIVSQGGSSLAAALSQATDLARREQASGGERVVVLITDGEALEEEDRVIAAAGRARAAGVVVHAVGIGTEQGAPVPEIDPQTGRVRGYKYDPMGEVVVSRRGDRLLERVTSEAGGLYLRLGEGGATERLLRELRGMERRTTSGGREVRPRERAGWLIALAVLLLALDAVGERRGAAVEKEQTRAEAQEETV